ncbi:hypothetical protein HXX76_007308 [Chlamydomonas incerta]|uniref:Sulfatase N-terminal domain-containing protein n=1 Tax=Chlamydomonas incerta TaxID=51695 RepID=A0A835T0T4_CHLIN|nr:hypothetical protein HXX76_007308 [Chlamydomonas incerta]|eukprot:KAG2435226.1 hypothetical protein HXX76_007308 [Chlamydomonas incerta]
MPSLDKYLRKQGLELPQFIVPGCPSRAALLTGRHCHNTNITSNSAARGGAVQFLERGLDTDYLPVWLQAAGYGTYLVGQFLNGFNRSVLQQYGCPQGWTAADVLVQADDPTDDGSGDGSGQDVPAYGCGGPDGIVTYTGRYHEEMIREKVLRRIDEAAAQEQPFFMMVATVAPRDAGRAATAYPEVMPQYRGLYQGERAPRLADWGVPVPAEVGFTSQRPNNFNAADIDARFRARVQALMAVDDTLALILRRLACHELLDDTIVLFSSESGFKLGSHNLAQDKSTYFEEDVRVPLLMAGPGVPVGVYAAEVTAAAVDLTATLTYLAGITSEPGNSALDGAPLPLDLIAAAYPRPNQPGANTTAARERPICDSPPLTATPPPSPSPAAGPAASSPPSPQPASPSPAHQPPLPPRPLQPPGTRRPPRPPPPPPPVNLAAMEQTSTATSGRRMLLELAFEAGDGEARREEGIDGTVEVGAADLPGVQLVQQQDASGAMGRSTTSDSPLSQFLSFVRSSHWWRSSRSHSVSKVDAARERGEDRIEAQKERAEVDPAGQVAGQHDGANGAEEVSRRARLQQQQQVAAQGGARDPLPYYGMWSNVRTLESWLDMTTPSRASKNFRAVRACSPFMGYGPPVMVPRAGNSTCFKYVVFCNPANVDSLGTIRMLFDLGRDPTELVNLYKQPLDELASRLVDRLDALLSVTAYCEGGLCRNPFRAIHIDGSVNNLYQAMDAKFDPLYASLDKFAYRRCAPYYHPENEKADRRLVPTHIRKWVSKT